MMSAKSHLHLAGRRASSGVKTTAFGLVLSSLAALLSGCADPPPPEVRSFGPTSGDYGTRVSVSGQGLGDKGDEGLELLLGGPADLSFSSTDGLPIVAWTDERVVFRYPFPAEGAVAIRTPYGSVVAGDFIPSWTPGPSRLVPTGKPVLSSVSPGPGRIAVLFDPPLLLEFGPDGVVEHPMALGNTRPSTIRLYATPDGVVEAVGVSDSALPELMHLKYTGTGLQAVAAGLPLDAAEYAIAGGPDGAAVWMRRADGWMRARPGPNGWAIDRRPIADPASNCQPRAVAATSDGALHIGCAVDADKLFDHMGAPSLRRLGPDADAFDAPVRVGNPVDDYLTSLEFESRGRGLVIRYCGSDVDPFQSTRNRCYTSLFTADGTSVLRSVDENEQTRHAFTSTIASVAYCGEGDTMSLTTSIGTDPGEPALWPCPPVVALEIDSAGEFLPVVRHAGAVYAPRRRP